MVYILDIALCILFVDYYCIIILAREGMSCLVILILIELFDLVLLRH